MTIAVDVNDKGAIRNVRDLENGFKGVGGAAQTLGSKIGGLVASLGVFKLLQGAVTALKNSFGDAISRVDTLNRFPMMMEAMGFSALDADRSIQQLSDGIQGLPTRLDEVAATAQNIAILTGDLDLATDTTLALNNAFLASGSSSEDAKRGLQQYVQMLSRGEVDMQSWRTLQETMGVALNDTAKAFGFTGRSAQVDLYDALQEGTITFDEFNSKIIELSNTTGGFADRALIASRGIKTSMANVRTAVVTGLANTIQTVDEAMQAGGFGSIADNLDKVKEAVQAVFRELNGFLEQFLPPFIEGIIVAVGIVNDFIPALLGLAAAYATFTIIVTVSNFINNFNHYLDLAWTKVALLENSFNKFFMLLKAHPYALIIAAVVGLVVMLVRLWQTNEDFRNAVINIWNAIKSAFDTAIAAIVSWLESMGIELQAVGEWFRNTWERAKELGSAFAELAGNAIVTFFKNVFEIAAELGRAFMDLAGGAISGLVTRFNELRENVGSMSDIFNAAKERVLELWEVFRNSQAFSALAGIFDFVKNKVVSFKDAFVALVRDFDFEPMVQQVIEFIPKLVALFVSHKLGMMLMGIKLIENIADGMGITVPELIQKVTDTIVNVIETFAEQLPQFIETGTDMLINIIEGITQILPQLVETAVNILLTIVEAILGSLAMIIEVGVTLLTALIDGIVQVLPILVETGLTILITIIEAIISMLPQLIEIGIQIITTLLEAIIAALPVLIDAGIQILTTVIESIINMFPMLIEIAMTILVTILEAIINALPVLIDAGIQIITTLIDSLITMLPAIIEAGITLILTLVESLISMLPQIIDAGIQLLIALIEGIILMLPAIIDAAITLVTSLVGGLVQMIPALVSAGWQIIEALIAAIIQLVPAILEAGIRLLTALIEGLWSMLSSLLGVGNDLIAGLIDAIMSFVTDIFSSGVTLLTELIAGLFSLSGELYSTITNMITETIGKITDKVGEFTQAGKDVVTGFIGGIGDRIGSAVDKAQELGDKVLGGVKSFFGINSPSREMIGVGHDTIEGLVVGMQDMMNKVTQMAQNIVNSFMDMIRNITDVVSTGFTAVSNFVGQIMSSVRETIANILNAIQNVWNNVISFLFSLTSNIFSNIQSAITNSMNAARNVVSNVLNSIRSTFTNVFNGFRNIVSNSFSQVRSAISSGMSNALSVVTGFIGRFRSAGSNIVNGIADGIRGAVGNVTGAISSVTQKVRNFLPFSPAKEGALRDAHRADFGWLFETAIGGAKRDVEHAMNKVLKPAQDKLKDSKLAQSLSNVRLPNTQQYMPQVASANVQPVTNTQTSTKTIQNDNGVSIHIEKVENNTEGDIEEVLQEAAWILNRERGRLDD